MKKGFTLIELLAVILILGIIALIAIPTVNKILNEAREGAFQTSAKNIMSSIQSECQSLQIRGENPITTYTFNNGKISSPIDIKGDMPDSGYIMLDNNCEILRYYLTTNNYVFSNDANYNYEDYMLAEPSLLEDGTTYVSAFYPYYSDYFESISNISFINNIFIPEDAIEIKDISKTGNGKVKSWLVNNEGSYILYVGSEDKIYANYDSKKLLSGFEATTLNLSNLYTDFTEDFSNFFSGGKYTNIDLSNFNTSNAKPTAWMFSSLMQLSSIDVSNFNTNKVTNMAGMFYNCRKLTNINCENFNVEKVTDMYQMFCVCVSLQSIDLSKWKTKSLTRFNNIFFGCDQIKSINLLGWDTSKTTEFVYLFYDCKKLSNIQGIENFNTSNVTNVTGMFQNCYALKSMIDLSKWDVSKLTNIKYFFRDCSNYMLNLSNWNINDEIAGTTPFTGMKAIYLNNVSDEDIAKIASLLSSSTNGIIYVDEVKDTYPEVTGWTYQQL